MERLRGTFPLVVILLRNSIYLVLTAYDEGYIVLANHISGPHFTKTEITHLLCRLISVPELCEYKRLP